MTVCIIELNDSEIRVAQGTNIVLRSPGYAVIREDKIELGEAAVKLARLNPRATHNRYWSNLNQDPLQYQTAQVRHNADLAYAHLLAIHEQAGKPEEVLFAVSGNYNNDQLALLLGLVEASPLKAIGLVDTAIAAAAPSVGSGDYIHVDIHLHESILTHINVSDDVTRTSVQVVDGAGLSAIYDTSAQFIADLFIKQSRFDPQHHAETEQSLYNQIPTCLKSLRTHSEVLLEIQYQQAHHQAKLPRDPLLAALQPLYEKIIDEIPAPVTCLIGDRLSNLPGFIEQLPEVEILEPSSVFLGCQEHVSSIRSSGPALNFVTRLPATSKPLITEITKKAPLSSSKKIREQPLTHVLHNNQAYPVNSEQLYLSAVGGTNINKNEDSHCSVSFSNGHALLRPEAGPTVFINGQQLDKPTEVQSGDIVSFTGSKTEYIFISVLS